jgi:hypothetical protein
VRRKEGALFFGLLPVLFSQRRDSLIRMPSRFELQILPRIMFAVLLISGTGTVWWWLGCACERTLVAIFSGIV